MVKEIKYNGYSATPSDYECADGDLAMTMGLIQENGSMKPVLPPKVLFSLGENESILCFHQNESSGFHNIIFYVKDESGYTIYSANYDDAISLGKIESKSVVIGGLLEISKIVIVGNTLCLLFNNSPVQYAVWKQANLYNLLGCRPPFIPIQFALLPAKNVKESFETSFEITYNDSAYLHFQGFKLSNGELVTNGMYFDKLPKEESQSTITNEVLAVVNKAIADNTINCENGMFIFPFIVRYALRMYDGSTITMHSYPVLMIPNSHILAPLSNLEVFSDGVSITGSGNGSIYAKACYLSYRIKSVDDSFADWKDIISSLDIFISAPLYTYDQSGYIKGWHCSTNSSHYPLPYSLSNRCDNINTSDIDTELRYSPLYQLLLPQKSDEDIIDEVKSCSNFYLIHSIPFDKIEKYDTSVTTNKGFTIIPVKGSTLASLTNRELMTDDYHSHHEVIASNGFAYNSKLHLADIKENIVADVPFDCLIPYLTNAGTLCSAYGVSLFLDNKSQKLENITPCLYNSLPRYMFFPHTKATQIAILTDDIIYGYDLKEHETLNGSVFFCGYGDFQPQQLYSYYDYEESIRVSYTDRLYVSEINNPFIFPLISRLSFPGKVLGISSAAKALSEGQFGQFPLYAFTTEGVWALEVSSTGTYSVKQPITRDVCINPDSITQIDSAVLFATDRGIMHISGSTVRCISDNLNTEDLFSITDLPKCDKLIDIFNAKTDDTEQITIDDVAILPFLDFLTDCRMIYDYTNQRIIVYNPAVRYAYVYSMKSQTWGMMRSNIADNVNSYPEALAMDNDANLVNLSKSDAEIATSLIVTRPFKIGSPDTFKTINTIIQRGKFSSAHVQQILYGSNDLYNWHIVWSSIDKIMRGFRGTPYKAYRLALICRFDKAESIYGCTVAYEPRMTNQVR